MQDVVADAGVGPVALLAHDMGTSVATELLARDISGGLRSTCSVPCSPTAA